MKLGYSGSESIMLADAHQAITKAGLWEYFARPTTPGKDGFILSTDGELIRLDKFMRYDGHSASSYGWTMRQMESIAKHGVESIRTKPEQKLSSFSGLWKEFMHELKHSPNPSLREQGAILRKFGRNTG